MCRLAKQLPADMTVLAALGFKPTKASVPEIQIKLENLTPGKSDTVVMELLSNMAFMGMGEERNRIPATRGNDGRFHIVGSLTAAPTWVGPDIQYIDATALVSSADPSIRNRKTSSGEPLWATGDTVHPAPAAYRHTATAILESGVEIDDDVVSSVASSSDSSFKRKRLESVVTRPSENEKKCSRGAGTQAGWLTGRRNHMAAAATVTGPPG
jgi:hypothetical protein